jgi:hypothetical protein
VLFIYVTKLASNEIFSPSNKIHREVGRAKDLSAPCTGMLIFPSRCILFDVENISFDASLVIYIYI